MTKIIKTILLGSIFAGPSAVLGEVKLNAYQSEDSQYKYFIGLGESNRSSTEAFKNATEDAYQNASASLFGVYVKSDSTTIETNTDIDFSKRNSVSTENVKFVKFELVDTVENKKVNFESKLLFRYPKSEYRKELERLSSLDKDELDLKSETNFTGSNTTYPQITIRAFYQGIEISDAIIYLNGERTAATPLVMRKKLKIGLNRIEVIHSKFDDYIKDFEIKELKHLEIIANLKPARTLVYLNADQEKTKVFIDKEFLGVTPLQVKLPSKKFEVKFMKDGFEELLLHNFEVKKGDFKDVKVNMIKKPEEVISFEDEEIGCADDATEDDAI